MKDRAASRRRVWEACDRIRTIKFLRDSPYDGSQIYDIYADCWARSAFRHRIKKTRYSRKATADPSSPKSVRALGQKDTPYPPRPHYVGPSRRSYSHRMSSRGNSPTSSRGPSPMFLPLAYLLLSRFLFRRSIFRLNPSNSGNLRSVESTQRGGTFWRIRLIVSSRCVIRKRQIPPRARRVKSAD